MVSFALFVIGLLAYRRRGKWFVRGTVSFVQLGYQWNCWSLSGLLAHLSIL